MGRRTFVSAAFRLGRLALVSYVVGVGTWTLLGPTPLAPKADVQGSRAAPLARGAALPVDRPGLASVSVDGLTAQVYIWGTVEDALGDLGLSTASSDRLAPPSTAAVLSGQRINLDRGLPVTLVDGGRTVASRSAPGTVADLLSAQKMALGPADHVNPDVGAPVDAGGVVRITRRAAHELTVREEATFAVHFVLDSNLDRGRQIVATAGRSGLVDRTYLVSLVDGVEVERVLLGSVEVAAPIDELRRLGTRTPIGRADIEVIIREAAARQGADAEQMLRVAWCESRFDPSAYNPSGASGLFQFMPRTWAANSVRAGYAGASPFDPVAAANVAAWMFARGSASLWSCK